MSPVHTLRARARSASLRTIHDVTDVADLLHAEQYQSVFSTSSLGVISVATINIVRFSPSMRGVFSVILPIQQAEFAIAITREEQADLADIPAFYQRGDGNFWVALADNTVVGTVAILDIGNREGALRKMFVTATIAGPSTVLPSAAGDAACLVPSPRTAANLPGNHRPVPCSSSLLREERFSGDWPQPVAVYLSCHGCRLQVLRQSTLTDDA